MGQPWPLLYALFVHIPVPKGFTFRADELLNSMVHFFLSDSNIQKLLIFKFNILKIILFTHNNFYFFIYMPLSTITDELILSNFRMASCLFWNEFCKTSNSSLGRYWRLLFLYDRKGKKCYILFFLVLLNSSPSSGKAPRRENFYKRTQSWVGNHHNLVVFRNNV